MENGWVPKNKVHIPEAKKRGFQSHIILRNYIPPLSYMPETALNDREKTVLLEPDYQDEETVLLSDEFIDDEATVLLSEEQRIIAYIKHLRTNTMIKIDSDQFVIGKSASCDYAISDNPTVSRRHVRIYKEKSEFWLEDLNSSNHTYVEEEMLTAPIRLYTNMCFRLSKDEIFEVLDICMQ